MLSISKASAILAFLASATLSAAQSGSGTTTRYWDCCKPSCAWNNIAGVTAAVKSCDKNDNPLASTSTQSGCAGGSAYMCSDQSPWAVNDNLAYGFAAVSSGNAPSCCSCYQLTFTSGAIKGKKMIVQATNTGNDVSSTQFDLAMPGGGFGQFDACSSEWGATSAVWGAQYGGPSTNTCSAFPSKLQAGCGFRWNWFQGTNNPSVDYEVVTCPAEIVAKSGCSVSGYKAPVGSLPASSKKATTLVPTTKATTHSTTATTSKHTTTTTPVVQKLTSTSTTSKAATPATVAPKAPKAPHHPHRPAPPQNKEVEDDDTCEA